MKDGMPKIDLSRGWRAPRRSLATEAAARQGIGLADVDGHEQHKCYFGRLRMQNYSKTLADEVKTVNIDTETRAHMKKMRNDVGRFG